MYSVLGVIDQGSSPSKGENTNISTNILTFAYQKLMEEFVYFKINYRFGRNVDTVKKWKQFLKIKGGRIIMMSNFPYKYDV